MMQNSNLRSVYMSKLSSKCKSKKEMYFFLVNDYHAYLPPLPATIFYFFKQIIRGSKEVSLPTLTQITMIVLTAR